MSFVLTFKHMLLFLGMNNTVLKALTCNRSLYISKLIINENRAVKSSICFAVFRLIHVNSLHIAFHFNLDCILKKY